MQIKSSTDFGTSEEFPFMNEMLEQYPLGLSSITDSRHTKKHTPTKLEYFF